MVSNNHINIMKSLPREIKLYFMASWLGVTHDIELVALKYELLLALQRQQENNIPEPFYDFHFHIPCHI